MKCKYCQAPRTNGCCDKCMSMRNKIRLDPLVALKIATEILCSDIKGDATIVKVPRGTKVVISA